MHLLNATALAWIALAGAALAEPLTLHQNEYKPLVNTRAGRVDMCGVHFTSVVTTLDQRALMVQGSVNSAYFKGKVPALAIKVSVTEGRNNTLIPRKVHFVSMRVGQQDTSKMKPVPGEDGNSLMLGTNMNETGDFFFTFPNAFHQGAWLSISLDPNRGDYTFRLPPFADKDADTLQQVSECDVIGLNNLMKELGQ